ncbi:MAG TPA: hypothetical protein VMT67_00535 [Terriglobales bacterium]|nr:hypothetical protein [Terriglobales bacterium]
MEVTWIAILASLCMGIGAALVFVFAVKKNYFKDVEDAKYHVFWSDVEELVDASPAREKHEERVEDDDETGETHGGRRA